MANFTQIKGLTAYDSNDKKIGTIADLYYDEDASAPTWATVKTGLFGTKVNFVPLSKAEQTDDGVRLAVTEDQVKDAPGIEADEELVDEDEERLYRHYNVDKQYDDTETSPEGRTETAEPGTEQTAGGEHDESYAAAAAGAGVGADKTTEDLSEGEHQGAHGGRMRLKKYIITENVQVTVPVQREVVRLEPEDGAKEGDEAGQVNTAAAEEERR